MSLQNAIDSLKEEIQKAGIEQEKGLGEELFLFSSTLAPVVNVDLLIINEKKQILLSWRNDPETGEGWHIPGTCIRFQETLQDAIQRCALTEIGTKVEYSKEPIKVYELHWKGHREGIADQRERAHFITLCYACRLSNETELLQQAEGRNGCLQWFNRLPDDLLAIQACYKNDWEELKRRFWNEMDK